MKSALSHWARACLLIALLLAGSPPDARADGAARDAVAGAMDHLSAGDSCCGPEAESVRGHPCLPVCGGPALSPADLELPLPLAATVAPEPGSGPGTRFVDLEPHPPKHASDPT